MRRLLTAAIVGALFVLTACHVSPPPDSQSPTASKPVTSTANASPSPSRTPTPTAPPTDPVIISVADRPRICAA